VGALSTYTFPAVTTDHTIAAFFEIDDTGDIIQEDLVLYLPLYEYELDGDTIISRDAYGHTCTVTGASWTPQGHYFDGINDKIVVPTATSLNMGTGDFTVGFWLNSSATTTRMMYALKAKSGSPYNGWVIRGGYTTNITKVTVSIFVTGGSVTANFADTVVIDGKYHCVFITADRDGDMRCWVDNVEDSNAKDISGQSGSISTTDDLYIGKSIDAGISGDPFSGILGDFWYYSRALTPQEITHNYEVTKWRYQ